MKINKRNLIGRLNICGLLGLSMAFLLAWAGISILGCSHKGMSQHGPWTTKTSASTGYAEAWPAPAFSVSRQYGDQYGPAQDSEEYAPIYESGFRSPLQDPLSTFSIDVDTASYSNVRRFLESGRMPPADAVRIEELINYFDYDYPQPTGRDPFSITLEMSQCPWNPNHQLVHVGLQGKNPDYANIKPSNLVFLMDVSGSMSSPNKLPLVKKSLEMLVQELGPQDRVAIVAYAGAAGLVLPSTPAHKKRRIIKALDKLSAGGSTAGGQGIELAYNVAWENLIPDGNNRVILCTDGDFNVGVSSTPELVRMIEFKRQAGIYLTICGFGMGNYKDEKMEAISNAGNGNFFYIDGRREAKKVFVHDMRANMFTLARDVKIQVEFNPEKVREYRLIGYENRLLAAQDFNDDKKDAGEIGPGHSVTALYEIVPADPAYGEYRVDPLKYQQARQGDQARPGRVEGEDPQSHEVLTIKFRYKNPGENQSRLITRTLADAPLALGNTSDNFRFSAAVAGWGMMLRQSPFAEHLTWGQIERMASEAQGFDEMEYRKEFIGLVKTCRNMDD